MEPGTKVSFSWPGETPFVFGPPLPPRVHTGTGIVISERATQFDGEEAPHVLVAVDPTPPEARHFVIRCAVTWLTPMPT